MNALLCASTTAAAQSLDLLDPIVQAAIRDGEIPGAVVLVGHDGQTVYRKAFGSRSLEPRREPMTIDTIFDIASLTKVVTTTTAVMQLEEKGRLRLNDPVAKYLPSFARNGKEDITVRELLTHYSGLAEDLSLTPVWQGRDTALNMIYDEKPVDPPGARFRYSDLNFITLGAIVETVSGMALDEYARKNIFQPLEMSDTGFLPAHTLLDRIAPTQYDEHQKMLRGIVHDPSARRMGGVAGNAGVFSTADDLAKFAQALLSGTPILSRLAIEKLTSPQQPPTAEELHGLGWDIDTPFSSNRGEFLPVGSFGHTGFTGTSLWIDPTTQTYIIILSNAVHPRGQGSAVALRSKIATAVAAALHLTPAEVEAARWKSITGYNETQTAARRLAVRNGTVLTGIDVLEQNGFEQLRGFKKIGLLTNQTGVDSQGRRTIDVLDHAPGIELSAIFSPEHGVNGSLDTTDINNSKDAATGVAVYSMYGASDTARRPPMDVLKKLDAVVVDIQDAGARFYTFETTLGYVLEAAAKAGMPVIVLDRPNPITGSFVQGPIPDAGHESFTNYFAIPTRPGMTLGELARLFNSEHHINAQLTVVPMQGWMRGDWYDSTGLAWINPSPNLRNVMQATLYPGVALVEGTNVSVGRGTDSPFELVGAPWIDARVLAQYLNTREISGVRFVPIAFTPTSSTYANQPCRGVNIVVVARNSLDAPELGIELASALHKLYNADFKLDRMNELLVDQNAYDAIVREEDPRRIAQDWQEALDAFEKVREKYLIYK